MDSIDFIQNIREKHEKLLIDNHSNINNNLEINELELEEHKELYNQAKKYYKKLDKKFRWSDLKNYLNYQKKLIYGKWFENKSNQLKELNNIPTYSEKNSLHITFICKCLTLYLSTVDHGDSKYIKNEIKSIKKMVEYLENEVDKLKKSNNANYTNYTNYIYHIEFKRFKHELDFKNSIMTLLNKKKLKTIDTIEIDFIMKVLACQTKKEFKALHRELFKQQIIFTDISNFTISTNRLYNLKYNLITLLMPKKETTKSANTNVLDLVNRNTQFVY